MRGTANVPGSGKKVTPEKIGAQAKLTGTEGQYVGFNEKGEAIAKNPLSGSESQYIGFDAEGKQVVKNLPAGGEGSGSNTVFFGTIGTEWTEDENTGVKSQLVAVEGVLEAHHLGVLDVIMTHERTTEGYAAFVEETNQFLTYITNGDAETVDGGVMFYIYGEPNTIEIPFALEVG